MALIGLPTNDGIELLKKKLFNEIKKFRLLDENEEVYYESEIESLFFDEDGILTAICPIPLQENFTKWNKYIEIASEDVVVARIETPLIQFVRNVGGNFEVKIAVSGEAGEIVYKEKEYLTDAEFKAFYYPIFEALATKLTQLENEILKLKGEKDG